MSYRDLRDFSEALRSLSYPRRVSIDNFRQPNFPLVAEILLWLIKQFDENAFIPSDIENESDRVIFVKAVVDFIVTKIHVRLNAKRLYGADGFAVKEMAKVVKLLADAQRSARNMENDDEDELTSESFELGTRVTKLRDMRQLSSDITNTGAKLHSLLNQEVVLRSERIEAVSRNMDVQDIEKGIKQGCQQLERQSRKIQKTMDSMASDEVNLEAKISKKQTDLERSKKRLQSLQHVRPAFMDEYDRLERELEVVYETYIEKFRNVSFLESQLEDIQRKEQDKLHETEEQLRRMQMKLRQEEHRMLHEDEDDLPFDVEGRGDESLDVSDHEERGRPAVYGSMANTHDFDDEDDDSDLDDEDDDLLDDDEDTDSDSDLGLGPPQEADDSDDSDDDF